MPLILIGLIAAGGAYAGWQTRDAVSGLMPGGGDLGTLTKLLAVAGLGGVAVGYWYGRK